MAKRSSTKTSGSRRKSSTPESQPTWDEQVIKAMRPWGREISGVVVFVAAMLTLFGLINLIRTPLITLWSNFWWLWLGWVAYPAAVYAAALGLYHALWRVEGTPYFSPARQIATGLLMLSILPLIHLALGTTLAESQLGQGGGRLGFALAEPIIYFFGNATAVVAYTALLGYSVVLLAEWTWADTLQAIRKLSYQLQRWAQTVAPNAVNPAPPPKPRPVIDRKKINKLKQRKVPLAHQRRKQARQAQAPVKVKRNSPMLPSPDLLLKGGIHKLSPDEIEAKRQIIKQTLDDFSIPADVLPDPLIGPSVTQFAVVPGYDERQMPDGTTMRTKVRISKIAALDKDLALALSAPRIRIQAPVPGQGIVGVEVPNSTISTVRMGTIIESAAYQRIKGTMGISLGLDVSGAPIATDVTQLPHMLVAGQTGSGKSVFINAIISCLVFNNTPEDLQLVMIDPKKVELIRFNGLPHVIGKVETEGERAIGVLRWLMAEMDNRYEKLSAMGARNINSYNNKIKRMAHVNKMPYIVCLIDELADLMVQYGAELERGLCRLAQMARATGIHLIVATQRPSTDVLTGLIKANFPARASFAVASGTDSRVILDSVGAETLLGRGDMLFLGSDASSPKRLQGCFVSDDEIDRLVDHWKKAWTEPKPRTAPWDNLIERANFLEEKDDLLERAIALAQKHDSLSISMMQRRLRIGFPRAARLMQDLYEMGLVEDPKRGGTTRKSFVDENEEDPLKKFVAKHGEKYVDYPDKPDFDNLK
ncbi:MAG: DNA translocase FtsK [Ardenticatenaceae bacterium]|nr:DNA translocase FtsK [Ardenticatenaceae bacterium]